MKLYFVPGACSMAPHITAREAGLALDLEKVDLEKRQTASGEDFWKVSPKGYVPVVKLDNGQTLTEGPAILQYIADQKPESGLAPAHGTLERYRLIEWLNFISTEIHKAFTPFFNPKLTPEWRENQLELLGRRFDFVVKKLDGKPYLMGDKFTVADAYLFTNLGWMNFLKLDMEKWPSLKEYMARVAARPAVKETMRAEGLIK